MLRSPLLLVLASVLTFTLGACATDAADESTGTEASSAAPPGAAPSSSAEPAAAAPSDTAPAPGGPATVTTGEAPPYGAVLTDGTGMTLYVFFEDGPGQSACYDACAQNWPPLLTDGDAVAEGDADGGLLGTLERDDGTTQVTYDGQPLYRYADDSEPGDVRGFGSGNVWYPITPDGAAIDVGGSEPASGGEY